MIDDNSQQEIILDMDPQAESPVIENESSLYVSSSTQQNLNVLGISASDPRPPISVEKLTFPFSSWLLVFIVILVFFNAILFISWKRISKKIDVLPKKA